ncbi:hypothetical protein BBJ28_00003887 [Nothophytophthora sp. Chile5]|nr:hypothetical protein BBJ28_00003887 [Nothophytophthora sp. Chile5]
MMCGVYVDVGYWMNNIRQYSSPNQMPAMLLVGNKIDLPNRVVSSEEATMTQKALIEREKTLAGRRNKDNCTVQ